MPRVLTLLKLGPAAAVAVHLGTSTLFPASPYAKAVHASREAYLAPDGHPVVALAQDIAARVGEPWRAIRVVADPAVHDPFVYGSWLPTRLGLRREDSAAVVVVVPEHFLLDETEGAEMRASVNGVPLDPDLVRPTHAALAFALAHELSHAQHEDGLWHAIVSPAVIAGITATAMHPRILRHSVARFGTKGPKLVAAASATTMFVGALATSWVQEMFADRGAAHVFPDETRAALDTLIGFNLAVKAATGTRLVTDDGNYLLDVAHPALTLRRRWVEE